VIIQIDGSNVSDRDAFYAALREADSARLTVLRPGASRSRTFTVTISR
jgi:S1-C subfamily serine protease